jgi:hypothetical protein
LIDFVEDVAFDGYVDSLRSSPGRNVNVPGILSKSTPGVTGGKPWATTMK